MSAFIEHTFGDRQSKLAELLEFEQVGPQVKQAGRTLLKWAIARAVQARLWSSTGVPYLMSTLFQVMPADLLIRLHAL